VACFNFCRLLFLACIRAWLGRFKRPKRLLPITCRGALMSSKDGSPRRERLQLRLTWLHINADSGAIGASCSESFGGKYTYIHIFIHTHTHTHTCDYPCQSTLTKLACAVLGGENRSEPALATADFQF
jgi:hypothetical protein